MSCELEGNQIEYSWHQRLTTSVKNNVEHHDERLIEQYKNEVEQLRHTKEALEYDTNGSNVFSKILEIFFVKVNESKRNGLFFVYGRFANTGTH